MIFLHIAEIPDRHKQCLFRAWKKKYTSNSKSFQSLPMNWYRHN